MTFFLGLMGLLCFQARDAISAMNRSQPCADDACVKKPFCAHSLCECHEHDYVCTCYHEEERSSCKGGRCCFHQLVSLETISLECRCVRTYPIGKAGDPHDPRIHNSALNARSTYEDSTPVNKTIGSSIAVHGTEERTRAAGTFSLQGDDRLFLMLHKSRKRSRSLGTTPRASNATFTPSTTTTSMTLLENYHTKALSPMQGAETLLTTYSSTSVYSRKHNQTRKTARSVYRRDSALKNNINAPGASNNSNNTQKSEDADDDPEIVQKFIYFFIACVIFVVLSLLLFALYLKWKQNRRQWESFVKERDRYVKDNVKLPLPSPASKPSETEGSTVDPPYFGFGAARQFIRRFSSAPEPKKVKLVKTTVSKETLLRLYREERVKNLMEDFEVKHKQKQKAGKSTAKNKSTKLEPGRKESYVCMEAGIVSSHHLKKKKKKYDKTAKPSRSILKKGLFFNQSVSVTNVSSSSSSSSSSVQSKAPKKKVIADEETSNVDPVIITLADLQAKGKKVGRGTSGYDKTTPAGAFARSSLARSSFGKVAKGLRYGLRRLSMGGRSSKTKTTPTGKHRDSVTSVGSKSTITSIQSSGSSVGGTRSKPPVAESANTRKNITVFKIKIDRRNSSGSSSGDSEDSSRSFITASNKQTTPGAATSPSARKPVDKQPSHVVDKQASHIVDMQPSHVNQQPLNVNQQTLNVNQQPAHVDQQPLNVDQQPAHVNQQPPQVYQQPPHVNQQPLHVNQQPPNVDQQPLHVSQQPPHVSQQPPHVSQQPPHVSQQPPHANQQPPQVSQPPPT